VDDMGGAGELQRQQQQRPWREDPLGSPHHVLRLRGGGRRRRDRDGFGFGWVARRPGTRPGFL
jgi:hypothetical protein